jgi:diguanylate cyclase (GGDEF)-like protein
MYYNTYVFKFIHQLIKELSSDSSHYLFVKHYNTVKLSEEVLAPLLPEDSDMIILCHEFSSTRMQEAYAPFLDTIRNMYDAFYKDMTPEEFVDKCGVYPLQKSLFVSFLKDGLCIRQEDIILPEIEYERTRMYQSICSILEFVAAEHPLLMILNAAHTAHKSIVDLLYKMTTGTPIRNLGLIVCYNEVCEKRTYSASSWKQLITHAEKTNSLINWGTTERQQEMALLIPFAPVIPDFSDYIRKIHNMIQMLALDQADYYLNRLYQKLEVERSFIPKEQKKRLLYLYALNTLYMGDYSKALLLLEKLKELLDVRLDKEMYFMCVYQIGIAHTYNGLYESAMSMSEECQKHLPDTNHNFYAFKARLLKYIALFRGFGTIFLRDFDMEDIDDFYAEAEKYRYINHLAHVYAFAYGNNSEPEREHLQQGIELALSLDNLFCTMEIYKKNILVVSANGRFDLAEEYYRKCIDLLQYFDNPLEEANNYAGLGYNSTVSGDYEKANNYYNEALSRYYKLSALDNISEMLYNKAINALLAQNYENSARYSLKCLEILDKMKEFKLNLCNTSKLYGLAALSYFYLDSEYNCMLYLEAARRYVSHLLDCNDDARYYLWDDDLFLYHFITGLLNKKSGDYAYAQSDFDHARHHMMRSKGNLFFSYHLFAVEQADLYTCMGKEKEAKKLLQECLEYTTEHSLKQQAKVVALALAGEPIKLPACDLKMGDVSIEMVDELTTHMAAQKELARKEKHIKFLSTCQDMISQEQDKDALIQMTMVHIQNHFLLDQIILLGDSDGKLEPFYCAKECSLSQEQIQQIVTLLSYYTGGFVVSRMEKRFEEFYDVTSIFGENEIASFICIPIVFNNVIRNILIGYTGLQDNFTSNFTPPSDGEQSILRFSFKQLVDSMERIDFNQTILEYNKELQAMNNRLHESAVTDILTGLLNRQGFMKLVGLTAEDERVLSFGDMAILYIDLDSFKYYNDTFGHAVGDYILVNFASILKKMVAENGYAVRYGGDEFLLAFPDTSIDQAETVAQTIYTELEKRNYFLDHIPHEEDVVIEVPREHYISCSIGIACTDYAHGCEINETLKHADDALYYVKKHDKRAYRIWTE